MVKVLILLSFTLNLLFEQEKDSGSEIYCTCYDYIITDMKLIKDRVLVSDTIIYIPRDFFIDSFKKDNESMTDYLERIDSIDGKNYYTPFYSYKLNSLFYKLNKKVDKNETFNVIYFSKVSGNLVFAELLPADKYNYLSYQICVEFATTYRYLFILDKKCHIQSVKRIKVIR